MTMICYISYMFVEVFKFDMKKITLLVFFISLPFYSQIKGKITDTNKNALSFVSVYIDGTLTGTTSNDDGEYILPIQKQEHTLLFINF